VGQTAEDFRVLGRMLEQTITAKVEFGGWQLNEGLVLHRMFHLYKATKRYLVRV